jgi:hypothetical protein
MGGADARLQVGGAPGFAVQTMIVCPVAFPDTIQPALDESGDEPLRMTPENDEPSDAITAGTIWGTNAPLAVGRDTVACPERIAAPFPPKAQHASGILSAAAAQAA